MWCSNASAVADDRERAGSNNSPADFLILGLDLWWREHRDRAPDLFEQELAVAFRTLGTAPLAGKRYPHPEVVGVRRVLLRTTRNHVYYVVREDHVLVVAVWGRPRTRGRT